jgi:hypothetical protein
MPKCRVDHIRPRRRSGRKAFDFIPSKDQVIMGAFFDLAKPTNKLPHENIAKMIAVFYDEEI